jgi:hypothetical protein
VSLPNMIVEDEKDLNLELFYDNGSAAMWRQQEIYIVLVDWRLWRAHT